MKDNQNSQVADRKKITLEFSPHLSKSKWLKPNFFEIWSTDFDRKETKRAKKQWRRNVALSSLITGLSLSLFVFYVFLRNKIFVRTHTSSTAKPTFSFNKVTSNRNSSLPPPQRTWRSWSIPLHQTSLTR